MSSQVQVRVLRPHQSVLLSNNISQVQITLFRALPSPTTSTSQLFSSSQIQGQQYHPSAQINTESNKVQQTVNVCGESSNINNNNNNVGTTVSADSTVLPLSSVNKDELTNVDCTNTNKTDAGDDVNIINKQRDNKTKYKQQKAKQSSKHTVSFYDTCAVSVYNDENTLRGGLQCDYVGLGRVLSDCHGLQYIPHAVITGNEVVGNGYCSYDVKKPQSKPHPCCLHGQYVYQQQQQQQVQNEKTPIFAAGDTVQVDFDYLMNCKGILVGLTRYTSNEGHASTQINANENTNNAKEEPSEEATQQCPVYYIIRQPSSKQPLCLIPLHLHTSALPTTIALQLRPLHFASGQTMWQVNALQQFIPPRDVKQVVLALQDIAHDLFTLQCNDINDDLRVLVKTRDVTTTDDNDKQQELYDMQQQHHEGEQVQSNNNNYFSHYCVIDGQRVQVVQGKDTQQNKVSKDDNDGEKDLQAHLYHMQLQEQGNYEQNKVQSSSSNINNTEFLLTPQQKELYVHLKTQQNAQFVQLLANVPHVTRTGRQQYNVGYACQPTHQMTQQRTAHLITKYQQLNKIHSSNKSTAADNEDSVRNDEDVDESNLVQTNNVNDDTDINENDIDMDDVNNGDNANDVSQHNEILQEALRVAVPEYTRNTLVRYGNKAYNYGGDYHALAQHLVQHRASYAHQLAQQSYHYSSNTTEMLPGLISTNANRDDKDKGEAFTMNTNTVGRTPPLFAPHALFASSCQELLTLQRIGSLNGNDDSTRPPLPPQFATRKTSTYEAAMEKKRKSSVAKQKKKSKGKRSKSKKRKGSSSRHSSKNKRRSKSKSKSKSKTKKSNNNTVNAVSKSGSTKTHDNDNDKEKKDEVNAKSDRTRRRSTTKHAAKRKASRSPSRVADTI